MIVDAHMHLWDTIDGRIGDTVIRPLDNGRVRFGETVLLMTPPSFLDTRCTAEHAVAYFDDAGVDVGVIVQETMDGPQNAYLLDVTKRYPDRFFAHALIDYSKPESCLAQWKEAHAQGFRGLKLPAIRLAHANPRIYLTDKHLMKLWEALEDDGAVLAVDLDFGASQVKEMAEVARAFPTLQIALGHFAMANRPDWFPQLRLAHLPNIAIESGGICWLFRDDDVGFPNAQEAVRIAALEVGADKLMWGSDLPRTMVDFTYRQLLDWARYGLEFFSDAERDAFLGGNAARIYGLDDNRPKREPLRRITED
jgi:hypothetical protein